MAPSASILSIQISAAGGKTGVPEPLAYFLPRLCVLRLGELHIEQEIACQDFERWIADDIAQIERTVDQLLQRESVSVDEIDSVFLTAAVHSRDS